MTATVQVVCNIINPKKLPARPGTQFRFTLYHFRGRDQLGIPELVKLQTSDPAPFNGSSAHAQIVLFVWDGLIDYWVEDFVIDTPGGSGPLRGTGTTMMMSMFPVLTVRSGCLMTTFFTEPLPNSTVN